MNYPMTLCMASKKHLAVASIVKFRKSLYSDFKFLKGGLYALLLLLLPLLGVADDFPPRPSTPVIDYTGSTLSGEQIQQLTAKVVGFEASTSNQIAVVIMKTIGDN